MEGGGEVESTEIIEQRAWKSQDSIEKALTSQSEKPLMDVKQPAKPLWIRFPRQIGGPILGDIYSPILVSHFLLNTILIFFVFYCCARRKTFLSSIYMRFGLILCIVNRYCFICRLTDLTVSKDAGIEPRTAAEWPVRSVLNVLSKFVQLRMKPLKGVKIYSNLHLNCCDVLYYSNFWCHPPPAPRTQ